MNRVLKAANSLRWHSEVLGWIKKWTAQPKGVSPEESLIDETNQVKLN